METDKRKGRNPERRLRSRKCKVCGARFQPYRDNQRTCSRSCFRKLPRIVEATRKHHALQFIKDRKNAARSVAVGGDVRREINLRRTLSLYSITPEQYRERLALQDGKCAICGKPPAEGGIKAAARLHVDHDHLTGANRGLLCNRCNPGVGYFNNDPVLFQAAIDYLRRYL